MPIKSDGNSKSVNDVEEHVMKELNKKKETTNVWFEQSEENKNDKKTNYDSAKIKNSEVKSNRHRDRK